MGQHPISPQRTLLLSILSYGELTIAFSIFYLFTDSLSWKTSSAGQAIYFSAATATTLGIGDIRPADVIGRDLVIAQLAVFAVFVLLFLSTFVSRAGSEPPRA